MARKLAVKGADSPAWVGWCGMETFAAGDDDFFLGDGRMMSTKDSSWQSQSRLSFLHSQVLKNGCANPTKTDIHDVVPINKRRYYCNEHNVLEFPYLKRRFLVDRQR